MVSQNIHVRVVDVFRIMLSFKEWQDRFLSILIRHVVNRLVPIGVILARNMGIFLAVVCEVILVKLMLFGFHERWIDAVLGLVVLSMLILRMIILMTIVWVRGTSVLGIWLVIIMFRSSRKAKI